MGGGKSQREREVLIDIKSPSVELKSEFQSKCEPNL